MANKTLKHSKNVRKCHIFQEYKNTFKKISQYRKNIEKRQTI